MKIRMKSGVTWIAVVLTLFSSMPASAHNETVHSDMVEMSYEIMLGVANKSWSLPAPQGVSPAEWDAFLQAVGKSVVAYRNQPTAMPAPVVDTCLIPLEDGKTLNPGMGWSTGLMRDVTHAVDPFYNHVNLMCGVRNGWTPGGIFDAVNKPTVLNTHRDFTGTVLGFWAASVDSEFSDTHVWIRPTNTLAQGAINKYVNDAASIGLAAALAPFVCLVDLIEGHPETCLADAKDAGQKANIIDDAEGLIPGIGDFSGGLWTGFFHHIKVTGPATNEFDDHEGLLIEEAGPGPVPDPFDVAIMIGLDTAGMSLNYADSTGPKRYEALSANDGSPNTITRSQGEWQFATLPHTPFEPVDNLGLFGWKQFESTMKVNFLGWPLHAIGDATVPMHVAGTPGWGHRPFEDAQERIWPELRQTKADVRKQQTQVMDILTKAFEWRKMVLAYRAAHPDQPKGVPIRELITQLAKNTANYSNAQMAAAKSWPYNASASTVYLANEDLATNVYAARPDAADIYRPVLVDGLGATIAFLTSAAEVLQ